MTPLGPPNQLATRVPQSGLGVLGGGGASGACRCLHHRSRSLESRQRRILLQVVEGWGCSRVRANPRDWREPLRSILQPTMFPVGPLRTRRQPGAILSHDGGGGARPSVDRVRRLPPADWLRRHSRLDWRAGCAGRRVLARHRIWRRRLRTGRPGGRGHGNVDCRASVRIMTCRSGAEQDRVTFGRKFCEFWGPGRGYGDQES